MTHTDQTALWEVCEGQWVRLMSRWSHVHLPHVEWQDIRSQAFIKVFQQAWRYDPSKASPETWTRLVMHRSVINSLRAILPSLDSHEGRTQLRYARPILTRVTQTGRWGEEVIVVEPDMVDESKCPHAASRWDDFMTYLDPHQRVICDQRARGWSLTDIHRRWFHLNTYSYVWTLAQDTQRRWREYCS